LRGSKGDSSFLGAIWSKVLGPASPREIRAIACLVQFFSIIPLLLSDFKRLLSRLLLPKGRKPQDVPQRQKMRIARPVRDRAVALIGQVSRKTKKAGVLLLP
jgi:hypothetical protein